MSATDGNASGWMNTVPEEDLGDSGNSEGTALCLTLLEKMRSFRGADESLAAAKELQIMSLEVMWLLHFRQSEAVPRLINILREEDQGNNLQVP